MLQNMLNHEEKVHQVLEHVHNQRNGSIPIPNFLPPKVFFLSLSLGLLIIGHSTTKNGIEVTS